MAAGASNLIALVATIIAIGVLSQVLADRYELPSIIFLIAAGIILGPEGIGAWIDALAELFPTAPLVSQVAAWTGPVVTRTSFGDALPAIVGLSVAIIVFEGAFHLRLSRLREAPRATVRLVTVGAAIALVGTAVAVRVALDQPWDVSLLVGSLLVATGPTVIAPILEVVPVRDRVATVLETEGIVNDVTAAIVAVVVFEIILAGEATLGEFVQQFAERLGIGVVVGAAVAGLLWYLLWHVDLSPGSAPQNARLLVLAGALVAFGAAETIASESGIAAVATAGILLGNAGVPYESDITEFKGDITLIVLSFVFIALAALLQFEDLLRLGLGGLVVVVAVALVLRPLLVFISTAGDRFSTGEKLFVSFVGPRGIIPASVSTLFAVELRNQAAELRAAGEVAQAATLESGATVLVGTVFLVILTTVVIEGGFARHIADYLDVIPMRVLIIGGGQVGRTLADRLEDRGENVVIVEHDEEMAQLARDDGHRVHIGDGTDTDVLRSAGAEGAGTVVAATGDDDVNLLVAQLAKSKFDVETVIARANNPGNVDAFEDLGVRTISAADATAQAIDNTIERPALANWMGALGRSGDVQEIEVTSDELIGRTIREIGPDLPEGCLVALVSRDGENFVPDAEYTLEEGDNITLIGSREAVREAMDFCHPNP